MRKFFSLSFFPPSCLKKGKAYSLPSSLLVETFTVSVLLPERMMCYVLFSTSPFFVLMHMYLVGQFCDCYSTCSSLHEGLMQPNLTTLLQTYWTPPCCIESYPAPSLPPGIHYTLHRHAPIMPQPSPPLIPLKPQ